MAFRFKQEELIGAAFRRVGLEQIDRAETVLGTSADPSKAVHEARKCLKRIRALLRLVRPGLGEQAFHAENSRYRDIAHGLAPARDQHVLLQSTVMLEGVAGDVASASLSAFKKIVLEDLAQTSPAGSACISDALEKLSLGRKQMKRLKLEGGDEDCGSSVVKAGLEDCYRKALRSCAAARASGRDEDFHTWRKGVQLHWRHMAPLSRAWPHMLDAPVAKARRLSQVLGEDHDLAQLVLAAEAQSPVRLSSTHVGEIARLARTQQAALRREAWPHGEQLFAEGPRGFSRRMTEIWQAGRELTKVAAVLDAPVAAPTAKIG